MAIDAAEVRVAGTGHVYVAPAGTTMPSDVATALPADWSDLGYVTTDGVSFTFSRETEDLNAWQGDKIRVLTISEPKTVEFTLMQTDAAALQAAMGGGEVSGSAAEFKYVPPTKGENTERSMVIEFMDADITYRYAFSRVQVEGDVSFTLNREGAVEYPITFGVLDSDPPFEIFTNDAALDPAGAITRKTPMTRRVSLAKSEE